MPDKTIAMPSRIDSVSGSPRKITPLKTPTTGTPKIKIDALTASTRAEIVKKGVSIFMSEEIFDSDTEVYGRIYVIENDVNDKLYVGQTTRTLEERFKEHCYADSAIGKAIRKYGAEHFRIRTLEECYSREQLNEREIFWIAELNSKAPHGYNLNGGGKGGVNPSEETRAKNSQAQKGRTISVEMRAKISASLIIYYQEHPEAIEHLSNVGKGNKNALGHEVSQEARARISESKTNPSIETRRRLSESHKGKPSPKKGKPGPKASAETRAKMTAAQKARWEKRREQFKK